LRRQLERETSDHAKTVRKADGLLKRAIRVEKVKRENAKLKRDVKDAEGVCKLYREQIATSNLQIQQLQEKLRIYELPGAPGIIGGGPVDPADPRVS
jgi:hypothetical protein